jgi:glutathione S-transferase
MHQFELVWFPGTCGRVTLIALEEIGVEVQESIVSRGWHRNPEYLARNPKGRLPTLIVDGKPFTETPAILTLLAELYPEAGLLPRHGAATQIDALATMCWFSSGIHPLIGRARFPAGANDQPESFGRTAEIAVDGLRASFAILEQRLSGSEWLFDEWSIVDAYLLWLWFRVAGIALDASEFPLCADHAQRCQLRSGVIRALDREESAYATLRAAGRLPDWEPSGQVGRVAAAH